MIHEHKHKQSWYMTSMPPSLAKVNLQKGTGSVDHSAKPLNTPRPNSQPFEARFLTEVRLELPAHFFFKKLMVQSCYRKQETTKGKEVRSEAKCEVDKPVIRSA
jgi:hypothetical protein